MKKITKKTVDNFRQWLIAEEKSQATTDKYTVDVRAFITFLNGENITKEKLLKYKGMLIKNYAPASVNSVIASINCFLKFLGLQSMKVKSLKIQKRIFTDKERELSKEEYKGLLRAAEKKKNKRIFHLMQTICATGIRVSEVKYITVDAVKAGKVQIDCKGKMRVVMIPGKLCKALEKYAKSRKIEKGPIFVTKNGNPMDRSNIWHDMKKLC
ncbi:MAG: tyrosine-type recombinase/integrase [Clostridia bacterium]|nr:tyrosine-type recombinase/integrase [Clostridia bacterium]